MFKGSFLIRNQKTGKYLSYVSGKWETSFTEKNLGETSEWFWTSIDGSKLFGSIHPKTNPKRALDIWRSSCKSGTCKVGASFNNGNWNHG